VAFYNLQDEWDVENYGTPADIEVDFDPAAWRKGRDPQLEKAVEVVMAELKKKPAPKYKKPAYPNYNNGRGPAVVSGNGSGDSSSRAVKGGGQK
jgi:tricorn protease